MDAGADGYRRFLDGDDDGFALLIETYYDGLVLYLNAYLHHLVTAEELAEDTFVRLATKKPRFRGKSSFKTWLYAIGRNLMMDDLRRRTKQSAAPFDELADIPAEEEVEQRYLREERKIILHRAMKGLKAEYRQVLWLAYFEELSMKEIAQVMKKSVNSVEHLVSRARRSLKSQLEQEGSAL